MSSAYHVVKEQENGNQPESSIRRGHNALWKGIWNMHSPNAVKNLMWITDKGELNEEEGG